MEMASALLNLPDSGVAKVVLTNHLEVLTAGGRHGSWYA